MREYRLDLREVVRAESPRRLWALVRGLTSESATWSGEERWTRAEELAAQAVELIDGWSRIHAVVLGAKPEKLPDDARKYGLQIERPGEAKAKPREKHRIETTDTRVIAQWFARHH